MPKRPSVDLWAGVRTPPAADDGSPLFAEPRAAATQAPVILCLDAGYCAMGWSIVAGGAVQALGCVRTQKSDKRLAVRAADDSARRCQELARELRRIIRAHHVRGVICESPTGGAKSATAAAAMAMARCIVAVVVELEGLPCEWVQPASVKGITGKRTASKDDVEQRVLERWPNLDLPTAKNQREHIADSLGAYLSAESGQLVRLLNGGR